VKHAARSRIQQKKKAEKKLRPAQKRGAFDIMQNAGKHTSSGIF
jgi:hypothetical protein